MGPNNSRKRVAKADAFKPQLVGIEHGQCAETHEQYNDDGDSRPERNPRAEPARAAKFRGSAG